ncbi:hypothetical protein JS533_003440 [Bifidobacterium amazonense]|uniref:DUF4129 domain-containing protein n=1 Tax=Bifidobacterium amazonense TaxID=2809027 RepID=A0ABS9VU45_9BIFI|nr:hypothetical protein [Bifidobacterium amazonense]MCH9275330.1 hypothetical protein [Bifidobacterium amazonense]
MIGMADGVADLTPVPQLGLAAPLLAAIAGCLSLAIVLIVLAVVLSRPRRRPANTARRGNHATGGDLAAWRARIEGIVSRHESGELSRERAFVELAETARDFAGAATGRDMSASTLRDLSSLPRGTAERQGLDLLRQTVAALYPPEFADAALNGHAASISVREAAGWVSNLVERWR